MHSTNGSRVAKKKRALMAVVGHGRSGFGLNGKRMRRRVTVVLFVCLIESSGDK
jgi:hypothetical protein